MFIFIKGNILKQIRKFILVCLMESRSLIEVSLPPTWSVIWPSLTSIRALDIAKNGHPSNNDTLTLSSTSKMTKSTRNINFSTLTKYLRLCPLVIWLIGLLVVRSCLWVLVPVPQILKNSIWHQIYTCPKHRTMKPPGSFSFLRIVTHQCRTLIKLGSVIEDMSSNFL